MKKKSILIATGGTGGHVFPGLALAKALQDKGYTVTWLGTAKGIEAKIVPQNGITLDLLQVTALRGKNTSLLLAPWQLLRAIIQARRILTLRKPDLVIGLGGFVFGPTGIAATLLGIPLVIHEQNSVPGLTNRYLAVVAKRIFSSFPNAFKSSARVLVTGNPVRKEIAALPPPQDRFSQHTGALRILVLGGSQGATRLNELLPEALAQVTLPLNVMHQCGQSSFEQTQQAYAKAGVDAQVVTFIDDMAKVYDWADLVICRAGATTIAELMAVGLGAIFIPYPFATDDHQTQNALYLVNAKAGVLLPQSSLTASLLAEKVTLLGQREQCLVMAKASRHLYPGDATAKIMENCEEILNG